MTPFDNILQKFESVNVWEIAKLAILKYKQEIIELNQSQLWDGKNEKDTDVKPLYSQDPYFKSRKHAEGYKKWKQKITPNSRRNPDAPNLFINGYFHSLIDLIDRGAHLELGAQNFQGYFGDDLDVKFKNIYGLTESNWIIILPKIKEEFMRLLRNKLN